MKAQALIFGSFLTLAALFAHADVVVSAPSAITSGKLLLSGQANEGIVQAIYDGKKLVDKDTANFAGQNNYYKACKFKRDSSGTAIKLSGTDDCADGRINESLKLASGSYLINFNETQMTVQIEANQTTKVNLVKVTAPKLAGADRINLYVDYTSTREQNKDLFKTRVLLDAAEFVRDVTTTSWGKNNMAEFIRTGDYSQVSREARQLFYTEKGELCNAFAGGTSSDCARVKVGSWYKRDTYSKCQRHLAISLYGVYKDAKCVAQPMKPAPSYFLVLPGTYIVEWETYGNGNSTVDKLGVVAQ